MSIITPSLNGMEYLAECIASVRLQTTSSVEVEHILVDGGSTDGTPEYARDQGCTVITREERSPCAAVKKGQALASGELVGTIGCDDVMLPGAVAAVVRKYEATGARWLIGRCSWLSVLGDRGTMRPPPRWLSAAMHASLGWSCVPEISTFLQRGLVEEMDGYDPGFFYAGDYDFFARLLERREPFVKIRRVLCHHRRHDSNLSMMPSETHAAERRIVLERYGPPLEWQRMLYRYMLKAWLNGTNPRWFALKRIDALRTRRAHGSEASTARP